MRKKAAPLSSNRLSDEKVLGATVRFWAAARQAAGHGEELCLAATIGELRAELAQRSELSSVIAVASFLVDGVRADSDTPITVGAIVDVLPPFAGG
jgi:molybdopterin synthase sulfur carrier subunit